MLLILIDTKSKWNPENKKLTFFSLPGELVRISQYLHPHVVRKQQTKTVASPASDLLWRLQQARGQAHVHVSASAIGLFLRQNAKVKVI